MDDKQRFDLIIVGGGIGGVVCLYYARKAGLAVLLLETQGSVGGPVPARHGGVYQVRGCGVHDNLNAIVIFALWIFRHEH